MTRLDVRGKMGGIGRGRERKKAGSSSTYVLDESYAPVSGDFIFQQKTAPSYKTR